MFRRVLLVFACAVGLSALAMKAIAIPKFRTAADARVWAEHAQRTGDFADAAQAYIVEASIYDRIGDHNAAQVERRKATRLATNVVFDVEQDDPPNEPAKLAKWEPERGCYVGVRDDFEGQYYGQDTANSENFADRVQHPVAVALDYDEYGRPFPYDWAVREHDRGRAIQLAWEPRNIYDVQDDDYLNQWADDAGRSGAAIFLRFGGEMNGAWAPWGRSPSAYKRAFRIVHDVMARHAPNVAMVWAPNSIPINNLDDYYPGDDVVDWVGISLYIVRYNDDDINRPAWQDSIESYIDPFYQKYAARKPLCLAECGVTRRSRVEDIDADSFAADRLVDLLDAVKLRYPRLKMLCFFDRNNLETAEDGRRLNDYSLPPDSQALAAVRNELSDPYFLGHVRRRSNAPYCYEQVNAAIPAGYRGDVCASVSTYSLDPYLVVKRGNSAVKVARPFRFSVPGGDGPLYITVFDDRGHTADRLVLAAP